MTVLSNVIKNLLNVCNYRQYINSSVHVCLPLANIGRISGLPQHHVCLLSLNTESNSTGFSFQPGHKTKSSMHQQKDMRAKHSHSFIFFCSWFHNMHKYRRTFSNSTNVLIEASDQSNMTGTRLSRHASVWNTPAAPLLYHTPEIGKHTQKSWNKMLKKNQNAHTESSTVHTQKQTPNLRYEALEEPLGSGVKRLSALRPSATTKTSLEAGAGIDVVRGVMPWTRGDVK